ncbi:hypothetical protein L211DRAFT_842049 [Terfezia boudieri ATCC MYA-4762]|uniref:Uncharacterized protein n=1 Tax=Terfezia boudieri ATCC MYA-4762 TaxID=1051890 RepID=A0A3N4LQ66_9PEZI|nr:hypothetical protein L211DRAFT_842049 [Terfezia boudieri ATCC MYA-4762]
MPRKASTKSAALKRKPWALSEGLVTRIEKEVKSIGKSRPEVEVHILNNTCYPPETKDIW